VCVGVCGWVCVGVCVWGVCVGRWVWLCVGVCVCVGVFVGVCGCVWVWVCVCVCVWLWVWVCVSHSCNLLLDRKSVSFVQMNEKELFREKRVTAPVFFTTHFSLKHPRSTGVPFVPLQVIRGALYL